jgi:hypothetical protein
MDNKNKLNNFEHASDDWYKSKIAPPYEEENVNDNTEFGQDFDNKKVTNSFSEKEKSHFEFGRDQYLNRENMEENRTFNTSPKDNDDFEFGQDYTPSSGVNSENNRQHESKANAKKNNRTL